MKTFAQLLKLTGTKADEAGTMFPPTRQMQAVHRLVDKGLAIVTKSDIIRTSRIQKLNWGRHWKMSN